MMGDSDLTDAEFIRQFEDCTLQSFKHRDHLRLAWLYLAAAPYDEATLRMEMSIRRFAASRGASGKYHHTLTIAWMRLVAGARMRMADGATFDEFLASNSGLLATSEPGRYYSADVLWSDEARAGWVEPDILALPLIGQST